MLKFINKFVIYFFQIIKVIFKKLGKRIYKYNLKYFKIIKL